MRCRTFLTLNNININVFKSARDLTTFRNFETKVRLSWVEKKLSTYYLPN